jgi:hypothetical protein
MTRPISLKEEHKQRDAADESHRAVTRSWAPNDGEKLIRNPFILTTLYP